MQLLSSERSLSQYTIGRGSTRLAERLTSRKRASTAPSGALSPLAEEAPAKLNDWRQRFVEVRFLFCPCCQTWWAAEAFSNPKPKLACSPACRAVASYRRIASHKAESLSVFTSIAASALLVVLILLLL